MDWQITGHKKQLELLEKAIRNGKLAHAYIFAGPAGTGKRTIAKKIASSMLEASGDFHPDFLEIDGTNGIKIEQIRDLIYKLSLKPYQAKYKIAVVDAADQMTTEAANALLKLLEEPKDHTFIILITSNPNRLPKTILSRSQKITFGPLTQSEKSSLNLDLSEEFLEEQKKADEYFEVLMSEKIPDKLIAAYELADLETPEIKKIMELWLMRLEQSLLLVPAKNIAKKISMVSASRRFLEQNVNSKLLLTNLMLNT